MAETYRKLYRSRNERMIAGVCGGLGEYFNIDPTLIRLLFVFLALAGGPGLVAYIVLLVVVPEEPLSSENKPSTASQQVVTPEPEPVQEPITEPETGSEDE
jgi:phage shock protein PspC (stress-responsive transcriptional regulator)